MFEIKVIYLGPWPFVRNVILREQHRHLTQTQTIVTS